jgi:hypothetical protein
MPRVGFEPTIPAFEREKTVHELDRAAIVIGAFSEYPCSNVIFCVAAHCFKIIYKNSVRTSQQTHYVSATKTNRLMLLRETIVAYSENRMKHTITLCGHNVQFQYVKAGGTYNDHGASNS